jgi:hypothetical protein
MRAWSTAQGAWSWGLGAWGQSLLAVVLMLVMACGAFGQTASDLGEGLRAELTATPGTTAIKWWGKAGRTYFVQSSDSLLPDSWQYMPVVEAGAGAVCNWNLQTSASKMFVRLVYTDLPTGGNAAMADFDGDGISNAAEVAVGGPGTDPFLADSDWDGHSDAAEILAGTSPTSGSSNPGGGTSSGPLNPDASYRRGLRLEYSSMHMRAESNSYPDEGVQKYSSSGYGMHLRPTGSTYFYPAKTDNKDLTQEIIDKYESEPFLAPERAMFHPWPSVGIERIEKYYRFSPDHTPLFNEEKEYTREKKQITVVASPGAPAGARRSFFAYVTEGGYGAEYYKAEGIVDVSPLNIQLSAGLKDVMEEPGQAKVLELAVNPAPPDLAPQDDTKRTSQWLYAWFMDVDIDPVAGMAGVVGDVVPSVRPGSKVRHFVTPRLTPELPQPEVELRVTSWSNAATFNDYFQWDCDGGQQGADSLSWKVSRSTAAVTKVRIKAKKTKVVVSEMHVWVVWCDPPTITDASATFGDWYHNVLGAFMKVGKKYYCTTNWKFKYVIKPAMIITADERPDLEGGPKEDPPGYTKPYLAEPDTEPDTANSKWDVSRQVKLTIRNPNSISEASLRFACQGSMFDGQPLALKVHDYPSNPAEGNDDPDDSTEASDPYNPSTTEHLEHGVGEMTSVDAPKFLEVDAWTTPGGSLDIEANFREFCRLEITDGARSTGTFWFRISDYTPWHHYLNSIRGASEWEDTSSMSGRNHPIP